MWRADLVARALHGEDRNTWEPKEHLLEEWVQQQAEEVKQKAVEHHQRTGRWV